MNKDRETIQEFEKIKIDPFTLTRDILKNWWVILVGAVSAALLTYVLVNVRYVPQYSTSTTFAVASKGDSNALNNLSSANTMAKTFEKIIQSNVMKKIVSEKLGIDEIESNKITTEVLEGTNMLILTVTEDSPKEAIDMIRVIMDHYSEVSFYSVGNTVMDVLQEPTVPVSPDNPLDARGAMKKGGIVGALLLILLIGFLSYMNDTIKQEDDIERKLDARNLGTIFYERKHKSLWEIIRRKKKKALLVNNPMSGFSFVEAYKKLATTVEYQMRKKNQKVLVVTSVSENEGKSTVAANLAITLAEQSKNVLLIDGDLRRPSQFLIFDVHPKKESEFGEYLRGKDNTGNIIYKSEVPGLCLVLGRNCYSSSTEMLRSNKLSKLIDISRKNVDYVIIDSPPAGLMGDAEALAEYADAVLVVAKQNYILAEDINDVLDSFREHHSDVLGVVLNGARSFSSLSVVGHYGRYGRYGKYNNYGKR